MRLQHVSDREGYLKTRGHHKQSEHTLNIGSSSGVQTDLPLMRKLRRSDRTSVSLVPREEKLLIQAVSQLLKVAPLSAYQTARLVH